MTASAARLDLKMDAAEKDVVSRAAALMGTTMSAFMRAAAKDKALELLERESRITLNDRDFQAFAAALNADFAPNAALQGALADPAKVKRA